MPQSLPIIDISQLLAVDVTDSCAELSEATKSVAAQIRDAMEHTGFFYISGYSVESRIIDDVQRAQKNFFSLSTAQKNKSAISRDNRGYLASGMAKMHGAKEHDQKEVFFWGAELDDKHPLRVQNAPLCGPNLWPEDPADFKTAVLNYSSHIQKIGNALLRAIAVSLNLTPDFFEPHYKDSLLRGQLIRYPQTEGGSDAFGVAPHTDFGCITLLLQTTPGLEVKTRDGEWISAPPIADTLVVNIGDLLARWSDDRLPTNVHRVKNTSNAERFSIAMFHDPNPLALVAPADMGSDRQQYEPVEAAAYILGRNSGAFSHYGELKSAT